MYTTVVHSRKSVIEDAGDALYRTIVSAIGGQEATVLHHGEPIWEVELDGVFQDAPHPKVTVAFLGGSIDGLSEDVVRREQRDHARQEGLPF